ncbi:MAG: sulfite exporter TauE/SafE family protein [Gammaproteobacteria bacterium]|nr:sulfite exporter TauE/SafE family protein [Gammaproteobacteria bacterium]
MASIALAAALYSSVGQGGASGYLAVMALFGFDTVFMKPAVLMMNIAVTSLILWRLRRRIELNRSLFQTLVIASVPAAFIGGAMQLESTMYRMVVGVVLCLAAIRLIGWGPEVSHARPPEKWRASLAGAGSGFLGGLTGIGGGVLLSPLLLFMRWSTNREVVFLAAGFIFVNSLAGIAGYATTMSGWPTGVLPLIAAALVGTVFGAEVAVRHTAPRVMTRLLGAVLILAAARLMLFAGI